ncbi:precorrin-6y C5,15-methyltransferase (decarboxylating) subunit CbiE [Xanthovirga aplysinae]|uniref:precorrin-6y C5,15-methyltransferase (decarboxylating) subunit CbiE n=1 Tax=Xanthovirga aplysinae TaxID=2529853 RepID=UPI0012BC6D39|nr:precorrin-6y C5,15-methyltransferase (decarboxylating) subunit CbiE [Xanthovirga aplysinae]MTI33553.1 precorrin-6y C5,15-methyltransferase (decarboxylating) subunit CbiE [Xanthovirga aplysinae]
MLSFLLIGITERRKVQDGDLLRSLLQKYRYFVGGKRHYEMVQPWLPSHHEWIFIQGDMLALRNKLSALQQKVLCFVSGDPYFYGFGNTLKKWFPTAEVESYPWFSSIQTLAHRFGLNQNDLQTVSVHGRSWQLLDAALVKQIPLIGVLTDEKKNPTTIAQRMLHWGINFYDMYVGENLDSSKECLQRLTLEEAAGKSFGPLNCVLLKRNTAFVQRPRVDLKTLEGRPNMMTKLPIRLLNIHFLAPEPGDVFWDVGACTGSIGIEFKKKEAQSEVWAFEIREKCRELIPENFKNQLTGPVETVIGDVLEHKFAGFPLPNKVFIGGHGGRLEELLNIIAGMLQPQSRVVMNTIKAESREIFLDFVQRKGWKLLADERLKYNEHNEISVLGVST